MASSSLQQQQPSEGWQVVMEFFRERDREWRERIESMRLELAGLAEVVRGQQVALGEFAAMQRAQARIETQLTTFNYSITRLVEVHLPELQRDLERQIESLAAALDVQTSKIDNRDKLEVAVAQENARGRWMFRAGLATGLTGLVTTVINVVSSVPKP